jgi:formiminotetrahydrofolate cyclodeaminase
MRKHFISSQAYGLPQSTEEEAKIKNDKLQNALINATLVPLENTGMVPRLLICMKCLPLKEAVCDRDVGSGSSVFQSALIGAN